MHATTYYFFLFRNQNYSYGAVMDSVQFALGTLPPSLGQQNIELMGVRGVAGACRACPGALAAASGLLSIGCSPTGNTRARIS